MFKSIYRAGSMSALLAASLMVSGTAKAETESSVIRTMSADPIARPMTTAQNNVTSVSQLSDVRPTDWAFTALQSLVERYGCIAGYPDRTYRGQRAMTRFEFAAGLNACLDKINEIISAGLADKVSTEDLAALQRLQEEFAAELATLRGRVDALEARTTRLEAQQFSTTTKLNASVIFAVSGASDDRTSFAPNATNTGIAGNTTGDRTNITFSNRTRLNFDTSFTGRDRLRARLEAANVPNNTAALGIGNSGRLSFEADTGNSFTLGRLFYQFPIGNAVTVYIAPLGNTDDVLSRINAVESEEQATVSRFARYNPILRLSQVQPFAVFGARIQLSPQGRLELVYGSGDAAQPGVDSPTGGGLFGDAHVLAAQLVWEPSRNFTLGISYANAYNPRNSLGTGFTQENIRTSNGVAVADVRSNTVAGNLVWGITPNIDLSVWGAFIFAEAGNLNASTTFTSWMAALSFKDLFSRSDLAGIIFGQPLYRSSVSGNATSAGESTPYHLEFFYNYRLSRNISITPAVFFVFNPNSLSVNGTATVGVLRTTFTF
ncbi:MAG: iron uptake porin [Oscillatoriales cyanobacterium SM2_2_1]|nr:iron uptake porin [Oscillatoriales cyanobacterium SM2_2_1]